MFTNEQLINDDEIIPTSTLFFRAARVSERPIPSVPRIVCELNEQPTSEIDRDPPNAGNASVSTTPHKCPISFEIEHSLTTTDECMGDSSNFDGEIRIALVIDETSIVLSDIVSMLPDTTASREVRNSFLGCLRSSEWSTSEKWSESNDSVEFVNEKMQFS
ncbi:hypothetical protein BLNAU_9846 [Blattamonas nauphoetae]|uniref:Uncharacterized protein n=1 Tax=Blattamonas nauphoetae TaxID=2049346 RepID=A0ABQ9XUF4_9EUKA|nr:hypothetical protein BLNAU_9846 [Blattamonas nauphoetae]